VLHAVEKLPTNWDRLGASRLQPLRDDTESLYKLRVGADLRVLVRPQEDVITVVDVVRKSQIEGLRRLVEQRRAAS
jgi:hypothetical protein